MAINIMLNRGSGVAGRSTIKLRATIKFDLGVRDEPIRNKYKFELFEMPDQRQALELDGHAITHYRGLLEANIKPSHSYALFFQRHQDFTQAGSKIVVTFR